MPNYGNITRPMYKLVREVKNEKGETVYKEIKRVVGEQVPFDPRSFTHGGPLGREEGIRANK